MNFIAPKPICHGAVNVMGFGAMKIVGKYPAHWRASTHPTALTSTEYRILAILSEHPNQVLSRDRLMTLLKGYEAMPRDRSIDVSISRLRAKLENDPANPEYVRTVRSEGYLFCAAP